MTKNPTCPAALNIKGEHFACDWPTNVIGEHPGLAHSNSSAQAIWTDDPQSLTDAWQGAEEVGR